MLNSFLDEPPDSPLWQDQIARYSINTVVVDTHTAPPGGMDMLCASREWAAVYIDDRAAIFVRNIPQNADWITRLRLRQCGRVTTLAAAAPTGPA